jgi:hypothetical protein
MIARRSADGQDDRMASPTFVAADAAWLAHRYDPVGDHVHFVHAPRVVQRAATFLTDENLPGHDRPTVIDRAAALAAAGTPAPLHFVFHSAYCCSTMLARAFDIPGVAFGLKEPVLLNDLSGWRRRGATPAQMSARLGDALTLLARPFAPGEAIIVKPSNVVNALAPAMLALRPGARALLLYAPLRSYLASIADKGLFGRLWVRDLYAKIARDGMPDYGFSPDDVFGQTDLQIAAIGWLAQHRLFAAMVARFGPDRVRTLDSEVLIADPARCMQALAALYRLPLDAAAIAAIVDGEAFTRDSKTGSAFSGQTRITNRETRAARHAEEVDKVAAWAEAVAQAAGQSFALPAPLID